MNPMLFLIIVFVSIMIAVIWETVFTIVPAWRKFKIEQASLLLTRCLSKLNNDAYINEKIINGQYLHDTFYKSMMHFLCERPILKFSTLKRITYDQSADDNINKFRNEIKRLDKKTQQIIQDALHAAGKIIFLYNPLQIILCFFIFLRRKKDFEEKHKAMKPRKVIREKLIRSAEYYTVYQDQGDNFANACSR